MPGKYGSNIATDDNRCLSCNPICKECDSSATHCTKCSGIYYMKTPNVCDTFCLPGKFNIKIKKSNYIILIKLISITEILG